jgi:hypothetical protein
MNNKMTVVIAAVIFSLVGTLVFAAVAPYLSEVDAQRDRVTCPRQTGHLSPPCGPPARVIGPPMR